MSVTLDKPVPDFSAQATSGQEINLATLAGTQLVIYFYPKDNTPGCTTQGQDFRDMHADFVAAHTLILGVSKDSLRTHENFKSKQSFPFELISDSDESLCRLFDVIKLKQMYGKEYEGIERSTFLIDKQGVLRREWRKVKVKGHVAEVLQAAQELNG
ncbi:peroxiredoxin [Halopseudomonas laoshanensis]|uniref:thioredoxin-dependent peroxiredoxin n=1 Tax=Halopseudomonas laoshanensis TaxID=2268758 RepID=A0A7V7GVD7_9GAMM|nr:peroxiredoxin [Halopseudomonas laoshanensis]KAA0695918.1 peroxiredoxin [Halopseudomonas laoshanensis]WOD10292.1 peroxiredoxin [Pseudomonas sp. NyZ704]